MSRRPALKALALTAAMSAVAIGGFGLAAEPSASAASASPACSIIEIILGCTSTPAAPTSSATTTSAPTSQSPTPTVTVTTTISATASTSSATPVAKPKPVTNVALSGLRISEKRHKAVVRFTATNTGTLPIAGFLISEHIPGYRSHVWVANMPAGTPIVVTYRWPLRRHHQLIKAVVRADPKHQITESVESDNVLAGSRRLP